MFLVRWVWSTFLVFNSSLNIQETKLIKKKKNFVYFFMAPPPPCLTLAASVSLLSLGPSLSTLLPSIFSLPRFSVAVLCKSSHSLFDSECGVCQISSVGLWSHRLPTESGRRRSSTRDLQLSKTKEGMFSEWHRLNYLFHILLPSAFRLLYDFSLFHFDLTFAHLLIQILTSADV